MAEEMAEEMKASNPSEIVDEHGVGTSSLVQSGLSGRGSGDGHDLENWDTGPVSYSKRMNQRVEVDLDKGTLKVSKLVPVATSDEESYDSTLADANHLTSMVRHRVSFQQQVPLTSEDARRLHQLLDHHETWVDNHRGADAPVIRRKTNDLKKSINEIIGHYIDDDDKSVNSSGGCSENWARMPTALMMSSETMKLMKIADDTEATVIRHSSNAEENIRSMRGAVADLRHATKNFIESLAKDAQSIAADTSSPEPKRRRRWSTGKLRKLTNDE